MRVASPSQDGDASRASSRVELGRVLRARGLDGALLVLLHGEDPSNLAGAEEVTLEGAPGEVPFRVRHVESAGSARDGRARVALWLEGLSSRERAEHWAGASLWLASAQLAELPEDEFYWRDLLGARCLAADGTPLGVLEEIWPTAGHDVLVLRSGGKQRLVAASDDAFLRFDAERGELWLDPPAASGTGD